MELENNDLENKENENTENNFENNDIQNVESSENFENNSENSGEEERYRGGRRHYYRDRNSDEKDINFQNNPRRRYFKKKFCFFCKNDIDIVDYKDMKLLKRYVKESGKIVPKRLNGTCAKHQRMVTKAIKRARNIALLPYETRY
ncbi:30S ribosomal protein S18 [Brachyspira catarrhinii]|uniref:Small ribosomal subunit protein bS18 n=1 Tax=Brachyspira catarrhinii TaxID=2528966 RepID=A0ABY2TVN7_9SPIR|nr:30S ribosomal protein S18 [Brachyspira catarrhinii]